MALLARPRPSAARVVESLLADGPGGSVVVVRGRILGEVRSLYRRARSCSDIEEDDVESSGSTSSSSAGINDGPLRFDEPTELSFASSGKFASDGSSTGIVRGEGLSERLRERGLEAGRRPSTRLGDVGAEKIWSGVACCRGGLRSMSGWSGGGVTERERVGGVMMGGCRGLSSSQILMSENNSAASDRLTKFAACTTPCERNPMPMGVVATHLDVVITNDCQILVVKYVIISETSKRSMLMIRIKARHNSNRALRSVSWRVDRAKLRIMFVERNVVDLSRLLDEDEVAFDVPACG